MRGRPGRVPRSLRWTRPEVDIVCKDLVNRGRSGTLNFKPLSLLAARRPSTVTLIRLARYFNILFEGTYFLFACILKLCFVCVGFCCFLKRHLLKPKYHLSTQKVFYLKTRASLKSSTSEAYLKFKRLLNTFCFSDLILVDLPRWASLTCQNSRLFVHCRKWMDPRLGHIYLRDF